MIDCKKRLLTEATGWKERLKLRLGMGVPARYACRNVEDFERSKSSIGLLDTVIFPHFYYFPRDALPLDASGNFQVFLRDGSGQMTAVVSPTALNKSEGKHMESCLRELNGGDKLHFPILRNGFYLSGGLGMPDIKDNRPYLVSFYTMRLPKARRDLSGLLSSSLLQLVLSNPAIIPARN